MYEPIPNSLDRVKCSFRVDFTNGGYLEGEDFLLDLPGDGVSDDDLKTMLVEAMRLAKAGPVTIRRKQIVRRGEHADGPSVASGAA